MRIVMWINYVLGIFEKPNILAPTVAFSVGTLGLIAAESLRRKLNLN